MTSENRTFVMPDELTNIEFRCQNDRCGAALLLPNELDIRFFHTDCPHCHAPWFQHDSPVEKALISLRDAITTLVENQKSTGCTIRLEIKQAGKIAG